MKAILRNLISVARRFKLAAMLNILGLSVAFAAFMVIMIQLDYDYGFDRFHKDSDRIYRLEINWGTYWQAIINRPFAERFFESSPSIVAGAIRDSKMMQSFFHVESDDTQTFYEENTLSVTPAYFDVFTFDFIEGSKEAFQIPETVIIPLSLACKLFGNEPAVGQQLFYSEGSRTVGAVFRDFPANTVVTNCIYTSIPENMDKNSWGNNNYQAFIRVNHSSNASFLIDDFVRTFDVEAVLGVRVSREEFGRHLRLTALPNIHFLTDARFDDTPKASRQMLLILLTIAIVIIIIAAINFTNFSTALTPMRVKSINTQRVLGARLNTIRRSLVFEAVFISFLSCLVAYLLVSLFQDSRLARLVDGDLSLTAHPLIAGGTVLVAMLTGFLAGVNPARYMTSFAPALVLKGNFGLSNKGKKLRHILIGIQFTSSFVLIIGASFMFLQNHFMKHSFAGYNRDGIITVETARLTGNHDAFTNHILSFAGVDAITYGSSLLSNANADGYNRWGSQYKGEKVTFQVIPVHYSFLDVMGIEITEGRGFRQEDANTQNGVWVFNESARKQFDLEMNTSFNEWPGGEIIGFMPDINYASFRTAIEPMGFFVPGTERRFAANYAYIKLKEGANTHAAISHIRSTIAQFDAYDAFYEVRFFDEVLQRLYEKESSLSSLISLFSLLAIFISIVGVFGLVVFDSECRRKEIGIRKVLGASVTGIIIMFNKIYFKIMTIGFVIAAPLAWYAVHRWLENFAYKTPMYWWVYLLAFVAVGTITAGTVTFQNWRVTNENPAGAIKVE